MSKNDITVKRCCERLKKLLEEDYMFSLMFNAPFTKNKIEPTVFVLSDGGHGGVEDIQYCPFCGKKIETEIVL